MSASDVDPAHLDNTLQALKTLLYNWQAGVFEPLPEAFTEEMRAAMKPQEQEPFYKEIRTVSGDYREIDFAEAVTVRFNLSPDILYRFRVQFSKMDRPSEISLVVNSKGRISGMRLRREFESRVLN